MKAPELFPTADRERIRAAVSKAEAMTSGEIRIYLEDECGPSVLDRAAFVFNQLNMQQTELRNGVLIYLAVDEKKFAIIGDSGIHTKVGDDFWNSIKEEMGNKFKDGRFVDGLEHAILEAGKALQSYFPALSNDKNELPDDMIFGGDQ